jgi:hypothetical protein
LRALRLHAGGDNEITFDRAIEMPGMIVVEPSRRTGLQNEMTVFDSRRLPLGSPSADIMFGPVC